MSNRKRARVLAINIESDIQSTIRIPPQNSTDYATSMKNWSADLKEIQILLKKKSKKQKICEEYEQISSASSNNLTTLVDSSIHEINLKSLPSRVSERSMRACLTVMADDGDLGALKYHNFKMMNDGTFCFNISGKCPIHRRNHEGSAWKWQIHQKPQADMSAIKCWAGGYKKQYMTCLF